MGNPSVDAVRCRALIPLPTQWKVALTAAPETAAVPDARAEPPKSLSVRVLALSSNWLTTASRTMLPSAV